MRACDRQRRLVEPSSARRNGLTLIEVVIALVLMASVLVGSILAFTTHRRQLSRAEKRVQATFLADQWIETFLSSNERIPVPGRGVLSETPNWYWKTSVAGQTVITNVPVRIVRLEIVDALQSGPPLVQVDLVQPESTQ
ncbi:type IV pilus modification PilV family protein [Roseiconus lacunae]|uniref:Prepilin-type N-terminal cleavage/methylation domain-containing protein n=1 Tax=Roseiconus lacunae TaxID=2605694 RepID=A0ABT7PH17_9BACT|nr:prepilin-type N-terminal cleavage/methylation domain-containing protein [Roseiconus lacunae]MDM4015768.1 prepilin-type N-terminal cleavage/methylation domain-containing protein [Roseiconus lacunae]